MLLSYRDLRSKMGSYVESYKNDSDKIVELFELRAKLEGYDLTNLAAIKLQRPEAFCVDSASEWEKSGYKIKPGEEGIKVLAPETEKVIIKSKEEAPVKVRDLGESEKRMVAVGQIKSEDRVTYVNSLAYDITQTDCPQRDYYKFVQPVYSDIPHEDLFTCLKTTAEQFGFRVRGGDVHSLGLEGTYNSETRTITISDSLNGQRKISTLCNEFAKGFVAETTTQSPHVAEFESSVLSLMIQSRMGIPANAEIRKRITNSHRKAKMSNFNLNDSFNRLQKSLNHSMEKLEQQMSAMSPKRAINKEMSVAVQQSVNENFMQDLR